MSRHSDEGGVVSALAAHLRRVFYISVACVTLAIGSLAACNVSDDGPTDATDGSTGTEDARDGSVRTDRAMDGSTGTCARDGSSGTDSTVDSSTGTCVRDGSVETDSTVDGSTGTDGSLLEGNGLRVITLNMYLGARTEALFDVPKSQIPSAVATLWDAVGNSRIGERVAAQARAIARLKPHIVALQEATLLREQVPGDYLAGNPKPAEQVAYDMLELLREQLTAQGEPYEIAVVQQNADIELPRLGPGLSLADVRLTDRDVILVRNGVKVSNPSAVSFKSVLTVAPIQIKRGFVAVDIEVNGLTYRVVNTHIEGADDEPLRTAQVDELISALAGENRPLVLLGDFNSTSDAEGYKKIVKAGYIDLWGLKSDPQPGLTCCQVADLRGPSTLRKRIDLIFARNVQAGDLELITMLDREEDKTPTQLWPSDHAAVAARLLPLAPSK